ncbi:MAG TPA: FAD-binding oxidoreductase, partial [Acidimicrobiia bacterium]|nr:FAD-binding oxidoreductase [Acidimicrobiia bacterium]
IAGASVAYELAGRAEVVVLEAESVCGHHTTGRSAALYTECYGDRVIRALAGAGRPLLEQPPDGFSEVPLVTPMPMILVGTDLQRDHLDRDLAEYQTMVPTVRALTGTEVVDLCPAMDGDVIVGGIYEPEARSIDVHALHSGFLRGARKRGAEIRISAGVTAIDRTSQGWTIATGSGDTVPADVVVNAAGAWCDEVARLAGVEPIGLQPLRRTAFTFRPPDGLAHRSWPMILDVGEQYYFRPEGDRLLGSPGDETPMDPCDVRHDEVDVAIGIERIEAVTTMAIRSIDNAWAGLRSFVADRRPVNGWDPVAPAFYWLAGQGGSGIKTSPAMARFAAAMILDGTPPPDLIERGVDEAALSPNRLPTTDA